MGTQRPHAAALSDADIDALYGLEPVYEAGSDPRLVPLVDSVTVRCPWCGERYASRAEPAARVQQMVEDCTVCCQPIELTLRLDASTGSIDVEARRAQ